MGKNSINKIVVIGNGVAGNNAALAAKARDSDSEVTVISEEPYSEYSACALPDYLGGYLKKEDVFIKSEQDYKKNGIKTIFGKSVSKVDKTKKQVVVGEQKIDYNKLVIATGSKPIIPPVPGHELEGNFVLKTLDDTENIKNYKAKSAVIVGSGAIGVETAIALKERGYNEVTIVELLDWIFPKSFDEKPARFLEEILRKNSINVFTGEKVVKVLGDKRVEGVKTNLRDLRCEMVVWAVGVRPNVGIAKNIGVELGETGGIKVDQYLQTNIKDIYACGDCIESIDIFSKKPVLNLLWQSACEQGRTVGINCVGGQKKYNGSCAVLLVDIFEEKAVAFGFNSQNLKEDYFEIKESESFGTIRRLFIRDGKMVGLQLVGTVEGAGTILHSLKKGTSLDELYDVLENPSLAQLVAKPTLLKSYL